MAGSLGEQQREQAAEQVAQQEFQVEIEALRSKLASSCIEKVRSELEPSLQGAQVMSWDSTTSTYKLNGVYSDGEFACVLGGATELVNTAIIYPSDSDVRSWVRER